MFIFVYFFYKDLMDLEGLLEVMVTYLKECVITIKQMEKVYLFLLMETMFIKVNGKTIKKVDTEKKFKNKNMNIKENIRMVYFRETG